MTPCIGITTRQSAFLHSDSQAKTGCSILEGKGINGVTKNCSKGEDNTGFQKDCPAVIVQKTCLT